MNVYTSYVLSLSTYIHIYIILVIFYIFAVYVNAYIGIHTYACVFVICVCVVIFCYTTVSPASSIVIRLVSAVPGHWALRHCMLGRQARPNLIIYNAESWIKRLRLLRSLEV